MGTAGRSWDELEVTKSNIDLRGCRDGWGMDGVGLGVFDVNDLIGLVWFDLI